MIADKHFRDVRLAGVPNSPELRAWIAKHHPEWIDFSLRPDPDNAMGSIARIRLDIPHLKRRGVRYHHYSDVIERLGAGPAKRAESDSGIVWYLFDNSMESDVKCYLNAIGVRWDGYRCHCAHDCCGCGWARAVVLKRVGRRILAKINWGVNI